MITRSSNNYGPFQFPEKFLPLMITNALRRSRPSHYGDGKQQRDWLHVEDNCRGVLAVLEQGRVGEVYNIGGLDVEENLTIVRKVLSMLGKPETLLSYVKDRPGHDRRYALHCDKMEAISDGDLRCRLTTACGKPSIGIGKARSGWPESAEAITSPTTRNITRTATLPCMPLRRPAPKPAMRPAQIGSPCIRTYNCAPKMHLATLKGLDGMQRIDTPLTGLCEIAESFSRSSRVSSWKSTTAINCRPRASSILLFRKSFLLGKKSPCAVFITSYAGRKPSSAASSRARRRDVAVDVRVGSPQFGQWTSVLLSATEQNRI